MIRHARFVDPGATISVEVEKPNRDGIEQLIPEADVVFFSKAFALGRGWLEPEPFLRAMRAKARSGYVSYRTLFWLGNWGSVRLLADCTALSGHSYFSVGAKVFR